MSQKDLHRKKPVSPSRRLPRPFSIRRSTGVCRREFPIYTIHSLPSIPSVGMILIRPPVFAVYMKSLIDEEKYLKDHFLL
jgi:hypothetical protein